MGECEHEAEVDRPSRRQLTSATYLRVENANDESTDEERSSPCRCIQPLGESNPLVGGDAVMDSVPSVGGDTDSLPNIEDSEPAYNLEVS